MDVRERPSTGRVAELRHALYRPDPPAGAVAAYLAALGDDGEPAPVLPPAAAAPRVRRRPRAGRAALAAAVVAALVLLGIAVREAPAPPDAPEPAIVRQDPFPPATGTEIGAMSGGPTTTRSFDAGGRPAVVSVLCDRAGTLTLRIGGDPATVLTCQVGPPALALVPSIGALEAFTVTVTPSGPVRWTATVGALPADG